LYAEWRIVGECHRHLRKLWCRVTAVNVRCYASKPSFYPPMQHLHWIYKICIGFGGLFNVSTIRESRFYHQCKICIGLGGKVEVYHRMASNTLANGSLNECDDSSKITLFRFVSCAYLTMRQWPKQGRGAGLATSLMLTSN